MITLKKITLQQARKVLLENTSLSLYAKQKIGVIGDNGCGKSSFFSMLRGTLEPHQGELALPDGLDIAYVKQEIPTTSRCALDYVIDGDHRYRSLTALLEQAELEGNAELMANCHDQLAAIDGYAIEGRAQKILEGLGFCREELNNPTNSFSGGWRMRLNLAQVLISPSSLMLLDEPTNHLDLEAILWLEKWLQNYAGTLLIISHDREFLDNTVTSILHFNDQNLALYRGNYSDFERQFAEQISLQQKTYEKQQTKIEHMQSFIDRFRAKASKARQAQSRMKALEKMSLISAVEIRGAFTFSFKKPKDCPNPLLRIEEASLGYGSNVVLNDLHLQIAPSDRIGLLGVNGAGKSTLIKAIAHQLTPLAGNIHHHKGLRVGYFAQHQIEHLNGELSPLDLMREIPSDANEQSLRAFLGSFQIGKDMATAKTHHFSGGEKARLALAMIVWQAPNLLLLDEPTNHLDMKMREALILALQEYTGALLVVSHDRHLIRTTTDELMLVANQTVSRFSGDIDDYKELYLKKTSEKDKVLREKTNPGKEKRRNETKLGSLEQEITKLQQERLSLEERLLDPNLYQSESTESIKRLNQKQLMLTEKIKILENNWLAIVDKISH